MSNKVIFILKRKDNYNEKVDQHVGLSTGLYNSASFVSDMLNDLKIESKISVVIDNNCIDREVTQYKPTHVIIEALWVVPTKFEVLRKLHPGVKWIIRLHSEIPFIAGEGMAIDWLGEYAKYDNLSIAVNSPRMYQELSVILKASGFDPNKKIILLPNFYPQQYNKKVFDKKKDYIDIGCFGAIRPMKNHLAQAVAAIEFANSIGKKLRFHVNAGRIEMNGQPAIRNLTSLFYHINNSGHELINHEWTPREDFLKLCARMDIGMQCNFSETFNIVGADLISQGIPLVGSNEIPWQLVGRATATDCESIVQKLRQSYYYPQLNTWVNQWSLSKYTNNTKKYWLNYFGEK